MAAKGAGGGRKMALYTPPAKAQEGRPWKASPGES